MALPLVAIPAILEIGTKLIDKIFPDKTAAEAAKLKLLELAQNNQLEELKIEVENYKIEIEDRISARQREVEANDSLTPRVLAAVFTLGFFAVLGWMLGHGIPEQGGEALLVLLGALSSGQAAVLAYYFGSSSGSKYKSNLLAEKKDGISR